MKPNPTEPMKMYQLLLAGLLSLTLALPTLAHSGHPEHDGPSQESAAENKPKRTSPGKGKEPHSPVSAYKDDTVLGWKLLVHEDLIADKELHKDVMDEIHHQLYLIVEAVPADKVKLLKKVPIWVELNNPYSNAAQYHPSKQWLVSNGYLGEKANCVEISNAKGFARRWAHQKANTMLHEFAHAYHDLHLSFNRKDIIESFKKAEASKSYDKVQHIGGREVRHYAMTDHKEYFAEATEAFFGCNDHFPFVRPQLKDHDAEIHDIVKAVWGVER
ncbi:MAG: metallopeptidase [Phycisphaeraceae bacterium]